MPDAAPRCARLRLILHILYGVVLVFSVYRWSSTARRQRIIRDWSRRLLRLCGITLRVHGCADVADAGAMIVSNHVSWLDIYVIDAWRPTPFVAKSEIRRWPVIGWLAASIGTVFIERGRRSDAKRIVGQLSDILRARGSVCLFGEGTTSDGRAVQPFHANILQAAVGAEAPVQPITLLYEDRSGRQSLAPAYVGDLTLGETLRQVLARAPLTAHLYVGEPLHALTERRAAAASAHSAVSEGLDVLQRFVAPAADEDIARIARHLAAAPSPISTARQHGS